MVNKSHGEPVRTISGEKQGLRRIDAISGFFTLWRSCDSSPSRLAALNDPHILSEAANERGRGSFSNTFSHFWRSADPQSATLLGFLQQLKRLGPVGRGIASRTTE